MARLMTRGPHLGPIVARVRRDPSEVRVLIGGRNLAAPGDPAVRFTMAVDGRTVDSWDVAPGFFLRTTLLPAATLAGDGPLAELTVRSAAITGEAVISTAIEQFDVQLPGTLMWGFDAGWHEAEYTPAMGLWHWTSERSSLRIYGATTDVRVTLGFESPRRYFDAPIALRASANDAEIASTAVDSLESWSFDVPIDRLRSADGLITIESSLTFVPAERGGAPDRRRLGLRVLSVRVESIGLR
jgi:hypothetical protein